MEVAWARGERDDEEDADARGEDEADGAEEERLREGADKGENISDEVELGGLRAWAG